MKQCGSPRKSGRRGRTRSKFKKDTPKASVNDIMSLFEIGDKVQVVVDSSRHEGIPYKGYHGLSGNITGKRGEGYEVEIMRGNQKQMLVTMPVHLKKLL